MVFSSRIVLLLIASNVLSTGVLAALVCSGFTHEQSSFKELNVGRINIVGDNGKTVLAICNKETIAPPIVGGKPASLSGADGRENMAGMVFFNQEGDEMGGLLFNSFKLPNGKFAGVGHLSFDRYKDNQVLALEYNQNSNGVRSGLTVYDRTGNGKFLESFDLIGEYSRATAARRREIEGLLAKMRQVGDLGAERLFIGSKDEVAQVVLKDRKGLSRARLFVDKDDRASLEFLDVAGRVTARFPN